MSNETPTLDKLMRSNRQAILAALLTSSITNVKRLPQLVNDAARHNITEAEINFHIETMALARAFALLRNSEQDSRMKGIFLIANFIKREAGDDYDAIMNELGLATLATQPAPPTIEADLENTIG